MHGKSFYFWMFLLTIITISFSGPAWAADAVFSPLHGFLVSKGVPPDQVDKCLGDPALKFEGKLLARLLATPEKKLNYGRFLSQKSVNRAKKFEKSHKAKLEAAKERTGVPPSVVLAILTVETNLGSYTGNSRIFNVLASQAVLDTPLAKKRLAGYWPKKGKRLNTPRQDKRLAKRAQWARDELPAVLRLAQAKGVSPFSFKGSPAGAMGMCQFVPTSVEIYGADGDEDGEVDLAAAHDAIMSIGVYLKKNGWRPGLNYKERFNVILKYNNSRPYARTVLKLASRLK